MNTNQSTLSSNIANDSYICKNCETYNLVKINSKVNATYLYCDHCNFNKEVSLKQSNLDTILCEIKNTLQLLSKNLLLNISVELCISSKNIVLFINHIKINTIAFKYNLSNNDCYYLKNTILYLIHDYTDTSYITITIN